MNNKEDIPQVLKYMFSVGSVELTFIGTYLTPWVLLFTRLNRELVEREVVCVCVCVCGGGGGGGRGQGSAAKFWIKTCCFLYAAFKYKRVYLGKSTVLVYCLFQKLLFVTGSCLMLFNKQDSAFIGYTECVISVTSIHLLEPQRQDEYFWHVQSKDSN